MELPFVRLSLTNELQNQLSTAEILAKKEQEILKSKKRAQNRLRQNSALIRPPSLSPEPEVCEAFFF